MVCISFEDQDVGVSLCIDFPLSIDELHRFIDDLAELSHRNPHLTVNYFGQLAPINLVRKEYEI